MAKLNERQMRFVEAYLIDPNATKAAIAAGYSKRTANEQGSRLLANVSVQQAIEKGRKAAELRTGVTIDRVRLELARVAFTNLDDVADWGTVAICPKHGVTKDCGCETTEGRSFFRLKGLDELDEDQRSVLASIKVKRKFQADPKDPEGPPIEVEETEVKLNDKLKALELLGKHLGMFEQKISMKVETPLDLSKLSLEEKIQLEALLDAAAADE